MGQAVEIALAMLQVAVTAFDHVGHIAARLAGVGVDDLHPVTVERQRVDQRHQGRTTDHYRVGHPLRQPVAVLGHFAEHLGDRQLHGFRVVGVVGKGGNAQLAGDAGLALQQAMDCRLEQRRLGRTVRGGLVETCPDHIVVAPNFRNALEVHPATQVVDHCMTDSEVLVVTQGALEPLTDLAIAGVPFEQADNLFVAAKAQVIGAVVIGEGAELQRHRFDTVAATAERQCSAQGTSGQAKRRGKQRRRHP
ncbi:hypothetical protein D3C76_728390 [compost metagenome]